MKEEEFVALFFTIVGIVAVVCYLIYIDKKDKKDKKDNLEETKEDLIYKKINIIFLNINKDIFSKTLYNIKYNYENYNYKWYKDDKKANKAICDMNYTIALYQLNLFCLNCEFYKNVFNIFNQNYYFYNNNKIYLSLIEDFNSMCGLDDRVGELREVDSLSYRNFLINYFLEKYGQKLVRSGNESYYVSNYTLKQKYCLNIEDKNKYINEKENL